MSVTGPLPEWDCPDSLSGFDVSLYLHIPFCFSKCAYCDFYSLPLNGGKNGGLVKRYTDALLRETERRLPDAARQLTVPSLYIGGGTPSLLGAEGIARLLDGLALITAGGPGEITVEANPESSGGSFLKSCADHGVTRLSLGIQSFNDTVRKAAGRRGRADILPDILAAASEMFGPGLSVDLMTGLPLQTDDDVCSDIEKALSYRPGHVSLYALTPGEGTRFSAEAPEAAELPSIDEADRLWLAGRDLLIRSGYEQYEVSNFALRDSGENTPGNRSLHNMRYWHMENWIGVGPSASGTIIENGGSGRRVTYVSDMEAFLSGAGKETACCSKPFTVTEELDRDTVLRETLLMGFRCTEGPDPVLFLRRFGRRLEEIIPGTLTRWPGAEKRMLFLNAFLRDAFAELDESLGEDISSKV